MRKIIVDRYPKLASQPFSGVPHGRAFVVTASAGPPDDYRPLRLVVPGNIPEPKGGEIVSRDDELTDPGRLEIPLLGSVPPGVPVVGLDAGAVREHLRSTGTGWLASEIKASAAKAALEKARRSDDWARAVDAVEAWQDGEGLQGNRQD